ncbi:MAG: hypothetical protein WBW88_17650 [Rhodothermales bacterium]
MKAGKWTTVAVNKGLRPKHLYVEVWAPRTASWRRIGILPGFGRFRQFLSALLPLGIVQVKIRENRTCNVTIGRSSEIVRPDPQPENVDL